MGKSKVKIWCDEEADILYMSFKEGPSVDSDETEEGVRVEYDPNGEVIGVEISEVSRFLAQPLLKKIEESIPKERKVSGLNI